MSNYKQFRDGLCGFVVIRLFGAGTSINYAHVLISGFSLCFGNRFHVTYNGDMRL